MCGTQPPIRRPSTGGNPSTNGDIPFGSRSVAKYIKAMLTAITKPQPTAPTKRSQIGATVSPAQLSQQNDSAAHSRPLSAIKGKSALAISIKPLSAWTSPRRKIWQTPALAAAAMTPQTTYPK